MIYVALFFLLIGIELLYFKIVDTYNIIDKPNSRSSHSAITLRGGGIIFPLAISMAFF
jgi:UDP-N-acetylmuramyl pentapeptide phosphotransferase/UDP-N-acetylglucosamine-1-phosphate transferase